MQELKRVSGTEEIRIEETKFIFTEKNFYEEILGEYGWYQCTDCGGVNLLCSFKFCPDCGVRVEYKELTDEENKRTGC